MSVDKSVEAYIDKSENWRSELRRLREILAAAGLEEDIKWGAPCYTRNGKNVVGLVSFKSYFGLWFFQGALLDDRNGVLINAQKGKTKALRQWRMGSANEIKPTIIKRYVKEAISLADRGQEIKPARSQKTLVPAELENALDVNTAARTAFGKLRRGQQKEYALYVSDAKLADTKERRVKKIVPMIVAGRGLNDRYR